MSATSELPSDETGRRYVPIRCIVEQVEPPAEQQGTKATNSRCEVDTVVKLPGHCPFDEIVIVALQKLGYTARDMTGAKGSLQFPNWNSLSCDSVTDNIEATVESILGGVASLVTLKIRLHGRSKRPEQDNVKDKLLSFLVQRLQTVLNNSGCPLNQSLLNELTNGDVIHGLSNSAQQAFDRWFRDQLQKSLPSNQPPPLDHHTPKFVTCPSDPAPPRPGLVHSRPWSMPDRCSSPGQRQGPRPPSEENWPWNGGESQPLPVSESVDAIPTLNSRKDLSLDSRIRLLPNRNAVYDPDALLPVSPESREPEVLVVTPEMPGGDEESDTASGVQKYQIEPTDLRTRRETHSCEPEMTSRERESSPVNNKQQTPLPFRVLGGEYMSSKDSRSPSPLLPPLPLMHPAAAAAVSGLQNHLVHLQQQQQHAFQLAAMSRALSFQFGPSMHQMKPSVLGRGDCDRTSPFVFSNNSLPCPPSGGLTPLIHQDKNLKDQKKRSRVFIDPLTEIPKLERWFSEDTHPSSYVIEKFTEELNRSPYRQRFPRLEPKNLQLWFKNHRAKMKRHRNDANQSPQVNSGQGQGFDVSLRTMSPASFYTDWASRGSTPGVGLSKMKMDDVGMTMMTMSSCSPSSSTGSRAVSSPHQGPKSITDSSDDDMEAEAEEERKELD